MEQDVRKTARALGRLHDEQSRLLLGDGAYPPIADRWRAALRAAEVPILELNGAPAAGMAMWLQEASALSREFLMPVVVFADNLPEAPVEPLGMLHLSGPSSLDVDDAAWLHTRQVAMTRAIETSPLNREFRRHRERSGWIRIGWQPEAVLAEGNGLQLAWSSPLPLRRIRDFAARCPQITLIGPDAGAIAAEVAAQGISVSDWQFAVK